MSKKIPSHPLSVNRVSENELREWLYTVELDSGKLEVNPATIKAIFTDRPFRSIEDMVWSLQGKLGSVLAHNFVLRGMIFELCVDGQWTLVEANPDSLYQPSSRLDSGSGAGASDARDAPPVGQALAAATQPIPEGKELWWLREQPDAPFPQEFTNYANGIRNPDCSPSGYFLDWMRTLPDGSIFYANRELMPFRAKELLQKWQDKYFDVSRNHREVRHERIRATADQESRLAALARCPIPNLGPSSDREQKHMFRFRIDPFGNLMSAQARDESLCCFSVQLIFPWSLGGLSVPPNLMAVQATASHVIDSQPRPRLINANEGDWVSSLSTGVTVSDIKSLVGWMIRQQASARDRAAAEEWLLRVLCTRLIFEGKPLSPRWSELKLHYSLEGKGVVELLQDADRETTARLNGVPPPGPLPMPALPSAALQTIGTAAQLARTSSQGQRDSGLAPTLSRQGMLSRQGSMRRSPISEEGASQMGMLSRAPTFREGDARPSIARAPSLRVPTSTDPGVRPAVSWSGVRRASTFTAGTPSPSRSSSLAAAAGKIALGSGMEAAVAALKATAATGTPSPRARPAGASTADDRERPTGAGAKGAGPGVAIAVESSEDPDSPRPPRRQPGERQLPTAGPPVPRTVSRTESGRPRVEKKPSFRV